MNHDQVPYLKTIKELGYFVIGIDRNPSAPGAELADIYINKSYDEYGDIIQALLEHPKIKPVAVFTAAAQFSHVLAAKLANLYGIKYPSEELILKILNKASFYDLFQEHEIPIPRTHYVRNEEELRSFFARVPQGDRYYVKSDYSKNPKYIYSGSVEDILSKDLNWERDTHLRECYVIQPEVRGTTLRVNVLGEQFEVYDFDSGVELQFLSDNRRNIINQLGKFCRIIGLANWIVKFDVIDTGDSFVALDIGIDPPARMLKKYERTGENFAKFYVEKYLNALE